WSRMDIGEIFTGRMSPLGISFAKYYQYHVHRDCGKGLGLLDLGTPDEYMGYYNGHVYLNVAYTAYLLSQSPPSKDQSMFIRRFSSEEVDVADYVNPYGRVHRHPRYTPFKTGVYWIIRNVQELLTAKRRARRMATSRYREYDRALQLDLAQLSLPKLREEMAHCLDYFKAMHVGYIPFYINAFGFYGALEELCRHWLEGAEGSHLQNRLKGDMSNLRTVESARQIWQLCQRLECYPRVKALFMCREPGEVWSALTALEQGRLYIENELKPFMRENGVRGRQEMELTFPRWVDDPTYVFQMIKTYLEQGYDVDTKLSASSRARSVDTDQLLGKMPWLRRKVTNTVLTLYSACSRMREETRMSMITSIWLVRRIVYEVARALTAQGILKGVDEAAYLGFHDVLAYLDGDGDAATCFPRDQIDRTRKQHQGYFKQPEPPLTFIGYANSVIPTALSDDGASVQGLGTSCGRVSARARVIYDLRLQANELQKGEIIVTPYTDASWTPLFALAKAVVTDIGSMLSHSSIVAREFGIPSVVNTKVATAVIKT
ncbi:MAG: PEP-utilizing enzyme, partial [Gammaproteobacteria bacterium]